MKREIRVTRDVQQVRVPRSIYERMVRESELHGVKMLDFGGLLVALWSLSGPAERSKAFSLYSEWKRQEISQLEPIKSKNKRNKRK